MKNRKLSYDEWYEQRERERAEMEARMREAFTCTWCEKGMTEPTAECYGDPPDTRYCPECSMVYRFRDGKLIPLPELCP